MDVNFFGGAITSNPQWHSGEHASTVRGRIGVQFPVEEIFFKKKNVNNYRPFIFYHNPSS